MASKLKDISKNGWHSKKPQSSSSSSGGGIRGRVSGLVHRNDSHDGPTHQARPINELRDPSSFAPPPRRTGSGLSAAPAPSTSTRKVVAAPSKYQDPRGPAAPPPEKSSHSQEHLEYQAEQRRLRGEPEDAEEDAAPRGPYRVNTTGLATDHLPPPPGRRDGADGRSPPPPSYESATSRPPPTPARTNAAPAAPSKPSLPPRLPPRTNSAATSTPASPDSGDGNNLLNQGAVNRLGASGVSVPGLGIGQSGAESASQSPPPPPRQPNAQVNELQNRFSNLKTTGNSQPQDRQQPSEGTTWAQKQAALKTASSFQKDPSSVSMTDAKAAAGTANNFRQRHGEQVASGVRSANGLTQKYGATNKIGGYVGGGPEQEQGQAQNQAGPVGGGAASAATGLAGKKKPPPPPPPKKKPGLGASAVPASAPTEDEPPPVPLATKPTF